MPSKKNPKKQRCNKVRHATREAARVALGQIEAANECNGQRHRNKGLHVYHCPDCGQYHVGHSQYAPKGGVT